MYEPGASRTTRGAIGSARTHQTVGMSARGPQFGIGIGAPIATRRCRTAIRRSAVDFFLTCTLSSVGVVVRIAHAELFEDIMYQQ